MKRQTLQIALNAHGSSRLGDRLQELIDQKADGDRAEEARIVDRMASEGGIDDGTVRQIIRGEITRPPDERLRGFARVLETTFEALLNLIPAEARDNETAENAFALNVEANGGTAPDWIMLIPNSGIVQGKDGRVWLMADPEAVIANTRLPIPLDWEHATEKKAPLGERAPAAGWIEELQVRQHGAIWGRVVWTTDGRASVAAREYRFLSPTFIHTREDNRILRLENAGLTNRHNLDVRALNSPRTANSNEDQMNKELLKALGLPETATEEDVLNAINSVKTERDTAVNHRETPPLDKFVPRADFDAQVTRAESAETALNTRIGADLEKEIEAEVAAALEAKKIAPASKDYYTAMCQTEDGLDKFREFVKGAPEIVPNSGLDGRSPEGGAGGLSPDELAVCSKMGLDPEEYKKTKAGEASNFSPAGA